MAVYYNNADPAAEFVMAFLESLPEILR